MVARFHYDDLIYRQLLFDKLPAEESGEITAHVEACEDCQSKLKSSSQADVS